MLRKEVESFLFINNLQNIIVKEKIEGVNKAIVNILIKSKDENLKLLINQIINSYVEIEKEMKNEELVYKIDLTKIPKEICLEIIEANVFDSTKHSNIENFGKNSTSKIIKIEDYIK